jgi:hypothetical protein
MVQDYKVDVYGLISRMKKDPEFLAKITDDSESETCGLSVEDPDDFMRLVKYVAELFEDEELLKKIIAG